MLPSQLLMKLNISKTKYAPKYSKPLEFHISWNVSASHSKKMPGPSDATVLWDYI